MNLNYNVKVTAGPRSTTKVTASCTAVNSKTVTFANGKTVSSDAIAGWLETELLEVLKRIEAAAHTGEK